MTLDFTRAFRLAASMTLAAGIFALAIRLAAAGATRRWLGFPFGGIPPRFDEIVAVFANNVRLLGGLLAACAVGQLAVRNRRMRALTMACDAVVVLACANHVALVGATVGAYGDRGVAALLPHGPLELAAFSLGLSLYVSARREPLALRHVVVVAAVAAAGLAVSAVLEVMA